MITFGVNQVAKSQVPKEKNFDPKTMVNAVKYSVYV